MFVHCGSKTIVKNSRISVDPELRYKTMQIENRLRDVVDLLEANKLSWKLSSDLVSKRRQAPLPETLNMDITSQDVKQFDHDARSYYRIIRSYNLNSILRFLRRQPMHAGRFVEI